MTLTRLVLAWLPVAAVFALVAGLRSVPPPAPPTDARDAAEPALATRPPERGTGLTGWDVLWRSLEAAAVTLFASLWFDSLGHGEWWLLFGLVGLAVALSHLPSAPRETSALTPSTWARRGALARALCDVLRYVVAGAILAWRLG